MLCTSCGADNPSDARFCAQCGAKQSRDCPACGTPALASARFCTTCGAGLADDTAGTASPAAESEDTAERRQVTVMFCDIVGSTTLSTQMDPEDLREIQRAYRDCCTSTIRAYEGFVARYMGDGVLAYFGYPRAHEDDAIRAVRAALEIATRVPALVGRAETREGGAPLAVRVGIATGPVVIGELVGEGVSLEHDVVGETPNLAARLQGVAAANEVVIGAGTRQLLGTTFELVNMGALTLKGFDQPVRAWRVTGTASARSRFEASRPGVFAPFVGRSNELDLVADRWRRALDGDGQLIVLTGEPGIGKSRIAMMTREHVAASQPITISCQCSPYHQTSALYPVIEHLIRAAGIEPGEAPDAQLDKLEHLLGIDKDPDAVDMALFASLLSIPGDDRYPPVNLAPDALRDRTLESIQRAVESIARRRPLFFLVEDIHWSDPTTLELVNSLVDQVRGWRCLLMLTTRPPFSPPWVGEAHISIVTLNRLDRHQCEAMVESLTGGRRLPDEIMAQITMKTDGVPLFVEELTRTILDSGLVKALGDEYVLNGPLQTFAIPTTLQDSLMARLDQVDEARAVAQLGAVIGREFPRSLLAAVSDQPPAKVDVLLDRLISSGLLFQRGAGSRMTYVFKHALVRDAAYNSLLKTRRHALHGQIAQALRDHFPALVASRPELIARHYADAGLDRESLDYWGKAAALAMSRSACLEAISHLEQGLACLVRIGTHDDTAEREMELRIEMAGCLRVVDRMDEAFDMLDTAQRIGERFGLASLLARTHHQRGNLNFPLARFDACLEEHRTALEYARAANSVKQEVQALGGLGDANYLVGRMRTAKTDFSRSFELAEINGFGKTAAADRSMIGFTRSYLLELREAMDDGIAAVELAVAAENPRAEMLGWQLRGQCNFQLGEYEQGIGDLERCMAVAQRLGARRFEAQAGLFVALCHHALGHSREALAALEVAEDIGRRFGRAFALPGALGGAALVNSDAARRDKALSEGEAILAEGAVSHSHFWFSATAIEACLTYGEWERMTHYADRLEDFDRNEPLEWSCFLVDRARALARWGRGERDESTASCLSRLRRQAADCGMLAYVGAIDRALGSSPGIEADDAPDRPPRTPGGDPG